MKGNFNKSFSSMLSHMMLLLGHQEKEGEVDLKFDSRWGVVLGLLFLAVGMFVYALMSIKSTMILVIVLLVCVWCIVNVMMRKIHK